MTQELYRFIHVLGLATLFLGFGGIFAHRGEGKPPRLYVALHAIGLVVILVAGFGNVAKQQIEITSAGWLLVKIVLWLLLGALPVLVRKGYVPRPLGWLVALIVAAGAIYLGIKKPF